MILSLALLSMSAVQAVDAREPQGIDYVIEARLDEGSDVLAGRLRLTYQNNADVAMDTLWFHQHLNAFRPNSAWAQREASQGTMRFQELSGRDHAYEELTRIVVDGELAEAVYPGAPDSTVFALVLPNTLPPGGSAVVELDWNARLSTLPRRQGRRDRHYDWAQWYPRIAAYTEDGWQVQPLLPQGEFFGEFATYDVTLELAPDQVIGATGVPVEGNPGWNRAAADASLPIADQSDFYSPGPREQLGLVIGETASSKVVRFYAEDVHHFAWSVDPEYIYQGTTVPRSDGGTISLHALYWPSDDDWQDTALERTATSLAWLQDRFGPYPWPQLTNLHRLESGGTEFPMVIMDGSASEGLIMHETAHQYVHGIFANNEFREGWLDEGFSSYLTDSYHYENGNVGVWQPTLDGIRRIELLGQTQPIALAGAEFRDPATYSLMTYSKAELVFRMLEWLVGEQTMREGLREYYRNNALQHVTEADFRRAIETASGRDLRWFFDQWIRGTGQLDYAIRSAVTRPAPDGGWTTTVQIDRTGSAWMPIDLQVGNSLQRLESRDRSQTIEVRTEQAPETVTVDPGAFLLDLNVANNSAMVSRG